MVDEADGFEGDVGDLTDEAEDVLGIVGTVGVVGDSGTLVSGDLVLVDDPFKGAAIAEAVFEGVWGDAAEGEEGVVAEFGAVFGEGHALDAPVEGAGLDALEGMLGLLLVADVEGHENNAMA